MFVNVFAVDFIWTLFNEDYFLSYSFKIKLLEKLVMEISVYYRLLILSRSSFLIRWR